MQAFDITAVLVVHMKENGLAVWHPAAALLYWLPFAIRTSRHIERAIESEFISPNGERSSVGRDRYGTHPQPVYNGVGKAGGRSGVRKDIHDQNEMLWTLGTRKGKHVRDISDRVGDRARSRDVVRHE